MRAIKTNEQPNASKKVKRLCKDFGFADGMLKDDLAKAGSN